jgi:nicotinamidase-related amidase
MSRAPWADLLVDEGALPGMIDPASTALLVIDVQADFASSDGAAARMGADLSGVDGALARTLELIAGARAAGAPVVFVRLETTPQTETRALRLLNARKGGAPEAIALCRAGQRGADDVLVAPALGELVIVKRLYDAFHETDLAAELRLRAVENLVFVGLTTGCCIDSTARSAFHRDFNVFVVADATDNYGADSQANALSALAANFALITETAAVLKAWDAGESGATGVPQP